MKKWKVYLGIALALIAGGVIYVIVQLNSRAQSDRLSLLDAEYSYLILLKEHLTKHPDPEKEESVSLFLSTQTLNTLLAGVDGVSIPLTNPENTMLKVVSLRASFKDGFPEIIGDVQITRSNPKVDLNAKLYAAVEPQIDRSDPSKLLMFIRPLFIEASVELLGSPLISSKEINTLLRNIAVHYSEMLPHATIPLAHDLQFAFRESHLPLSIPTQNGKLNGEIDIPGMSTNSPIYISGVIFLSDGIHVFLTAGTPTAITLPYKIQGESKTFPNQEGLDDEIKKRLSQIEEARSSLQKRVAALKVEGSDFRLWVSNTLLAKMTRAFNNLSSTARKIHYHTLSEEGQIYRAGGGGLGCGGYANIVGGNSANADLNFSNLSSTWSSQGMTIAADFQFSFDGQVTGHVNGPAGPHATNDLKCFLGICTNVPGIACCSCEYPVGGGVGLGSYGVHADRTERITAGVSLRSDDSSWLAYDLSIISPDQIPITVEVGLGQLGTAGIPINFPVPHNALLSGKLPGFFGQEGLLESSNPPLAKHYTFQITPTKSTVQDSGYSAVGKINVTWTKLNPI